MLFPAPENKKRGFVSKTLMEIMNVSKVIQFKKKQHANLNPNLIFRGHLATILSNILLPSETVL